MSQLKAYPEYKDSGVEWIGEIPKVWEMKRIKHEIENLNYKRVPLSADYRGKMSSKKYDYYGASGIIDKVEDYIFNETLILVGEDGANLYSRSSPLAFLATGKYWVNNHAHILKPKKGNIVYFVNLLETIDYSIYVTGSAQPKLTQDAISNIWIPVPPFEEQEEIAKFITKKSTEIDNLISDKERLIELLEEKRQAVITETVTKGLDPDVKMKDSGIEWIGDIPEYWDLIKLKYIAKLKNTKASTETNLPYLGLENVNSKTGEIINYNTSSDVIGESILFSKNDVLFGKLRPYLTKCVIPVKEGRCTSEFLVLDTKKELFNNKYLQYIMLSNLFINKVNSSTYGAKMPRASWEFIKNIYLPLPECEEQKEIIKYVNQKLINIDDTSNKLSSQISKLKEYRESLIYEAVTGKIDVRNKQYVKEGDTIDG